MHTILLLAPQIVIPSYGPLSPSSQNDDSSLFFRHWKNLWPPSNGQELDTTQSLQVQLTTREFEDCIQRPSYILEGLETHKV